MSFAQSEDSHINVEFSIMNADLFSPSLPDFHDPMWMYMDTPELYLEPPNKRQRTDVDPLSIDGPIHMVIPTGQLSGPQASAQVYSGAVDPALEEIHVGSVHMLQHHAAQGESSEQTDLSAEYLALLDMETDQSYCTKVCKKQGTKRLRVHAEAYTDLPLIHYNRDCYLRISSDVRTRSFAAGLSEPGLPSFEDLQSFLSGYLEGFHRRFPILHLPSFDLQRTPSPLIMAVCSIGAQYRLRRQTAQALATLAENMSSHAVHNGRSSPGSTQKPLPLWLMQTKVLLALTGVFSGKPEVVLRTMETLGMHSIDFQLRKSAMIRSSGQEMNWDDWVHRESSKRLLAGLYIVSNLTSTTFGAMPVFSHSDDLDFDIPEDERFWDASSAQSWQNLRQQEPSREYPKLCDILAGLLLGKDFTTARLPTEVSVLTMLVITHAMNVHSECMRQVIENSPLHLQTALLEPTVSALSLCSATLSSTRQKRDQNISCTEAEGPLMFNCEGLVHLAHIRLFLDTSTLNRIMLINDNPNEITSAASSFVEAELRRCPDLTKVIQKALQRYRVLAKLRHSLLRKTSALGWSVEHTLADWAGSKRSPYTITCYQAHHFLALLVTKWLHHIETGIEPPDTEEEKLLQGFKHLLTEMDCDYSGGSMASALAQSRLTVLNEDWVWGVTHRMANVFMHLAYVYERKHISMASMAT